jgi:single-strand DNA-binding protein
MNKVFLIGRLTKDPELSTTSSGISYCKFSIAVDRKYKNSDGERETDFFDCIAWRQLAEVCGKWLKKGKQISVFGSIQIRSYEDKEGIKRKAVDIVVDDMQMLGSKDDGPADAEFDEPAKKMPAGKKKPIAELKQIDDDDDLPF